MRKYLMYPHAGSGNHGCEAIVRTTTNMLPENSAILFSDNIVEDKKYGLDEIIEIRDPKCSIKRLSFGYLKTLILNKIFKRADAFDALYYQPIIEAGDDETVLMSIGGDNYCYGENEYIYMVNRYMRARNVKTVLWGCSVEPEAISEKMRKDLERYDLIVTRESITYEALYKINKRTVLYPDPAFTLKMKSAMWPRNMGEKEFIGLNLSPLACAGEKIKGITIKNYKYLIEKILRETSYDIAFIPHVVKSSSDDREVLNKLYEQYAETGRVYLVEDQKCTQLKEIISKCRIFVGARTHATIAAYSTGVPTLVLGYSVKARGIAKDLFGTEEHYVLPVQQLENEDDLAMQYMWIEQHAKEIKNHLNQLMPEYIAKAEAAKETLRGLV